MNYRKPLYLAYNSAFKHQPVKFDPAIARRWARALPHRLRGWLPEKKEAAILDVACGSGQLLFFLKERGFTNLRGVDISPEQVAIATQVGVPVEMQNAIAFLVRNEARFDLITAIDIIEHFSKEEVLPFLEACVGALKPGGRLILQTPNGSSPWVGTVRYGDFTHEVCFTPSLLRDLMALAGLKEIAARELGPVPWGLSLFSSVRYVLWQPCRALLLLMHLIETGSATQTIFSRVFLASGTKPLR